MWRLQGRIQIAGTAMPDPQNRPSPNLCQNATVLHGTKAQACHLYANFADKNWQKLIGQRQYTCSRIATPIIDKNETDVWVETESISPRNLSNSEESRHNFEDTSSTQDQDIVQEQIQERKEPENEINICKFYIKKCCKHGLRGNNCNYPHPAPCRKYIENTENGCRTECTN